MRTRITPWAAATAALVTFTAGCARHTTVTTASAPTSAANMPSTASAPGEVALPRYGNTWLDSAAGMWMDSTGAIWAGQLGQTAGQQSFENTAMSNANITAHLSAGDSLEIALSQAGAARAMNADVRAFAQRMVTEHAAHRQQGMTMATNAAVSRCH